MTMTKTLPGGVAKLLQEPNFAHLATLMPDGSPHVSAVWVDYEGEHILVNTAEGRQKPRNLRREPRVALSIVRQDNPYQSATVRGRVVDITRDGADEHIDKLAKKYMGQDRYPYHDAAHPRLLVRIAPEHVTTMGV